MGVVCTFLQISLPHCRAWLADSEENRLNLSRCWKEELFKFVPGNTGLFNVWTLKRKQKISELHIFPHCGTSGPKGLRKLCKKVWTSLVITDT